MLLAALRPRMLELARDRSHGAHPYLVTPRHSAMARKLLGPDPVLAPEQGFVLETDPARARAVAREHLSVYLKLPNYVNSWREEGFEEGQLNLAVLTFPYVMIVQAIWMLKFKITSSAAGKCID